MSSLRITTLVTVSLVVLVFASGAIAQENHPGSIIPQQDTTVLPLIIPVMDDYAAPLTAEGEKTAEPAPGLGVSAYADFSSYIKSGSLAPSYRFSPALNARLRIPMIFNRTIEFNDGDASTSGLGDVAIDMEYRKKFGSNGQEIRFTGSLKLPTGDAEKQVDGHTIALGTGSTDFIGRLHYTRSTPKTGFLAALLYRVNSAGDVGDNWGGGSTSITNGNLFVASAFGRYQASGKWWLHLGASLAMNGDGEDDLGNTIATKATLIDLFPGVSYDLGLIKPYLGVRLPVSTSWDVEDDFFPHADRETSFVLQFTYNPKSMTTE